MLNSSGTDTDTESDDEETQDMNKSFLPNANDTSISFPVAAHFATPRNGMNQLGSINIGRDLSSVDSFVDPRALGGPVGNLGQFAGCNPNQPPPLQSPAFQQQQLLPNHHGQVLQNSQENLKGGSHTGRHHNKKKKTKRPKPSLDTAARTLTPALLPRARNFHKLTVSVPSFVVIAANLPVAT